MNGIKLMKVENSVPCKIPTDSNQDEIEDYKGCFMVKPKEDEEDEYHVVETQEDVQVHGVPFKLTIDSPIEC